MVHARSGCVFAMLCWIAVGGSVAHAGRNDARLQAFTSANDVYVDFAIAGSIVDGLDVGFLELNSTVVKWDIELKPTEQAESFALFTARTIRKGTFEVIVSPSSQQGSCGMIQQLNGLRLEPRKVVSCADAYRALSSFHVSVFSLTGVIPGSFDVTIRATVTAGESTKVKTPVLARAKLKQGIDPQ